MEIRPKTGKLERIPLHNLHIQYIPVVTPIRLWNFDMLLKNSPHVEVARSFQDNGFDMDHLLTTRYVQERIRRRELGMRRWSDKKIREHLKTRYKTFKSLKKFGYQESKHGDRPIMVLEQPFWRTRFGACNYWLQGREIYNGAGRCMAAYVLGWETIPVMMCEDKKPGSKDKGKFERKLAKVKGVWG